MQIFCGALLAFFCACAGAAHAQVNVDGSTSTTVTLGADGSVTVGVAPAPTRDSVSLNRYTEFNVPEAGVDLDNRTTAARTIVNEVTGTSDSRIEGPVEVLGQRAHVIIANPNGIVIDNGRFINTGRVALTTGQLGSVSQQIAPGIFQSNITSAITGGRITVEGGGLSGQMESIDLIAEEIRINGPVRNTITNDGAILRLIAGESDIEFDSAVLVGNTALSWGRVTAGDLETDGVLVEVGDNGLLEGGSVEVLVNATGAGVRFAGEGRATSRSFVLQSDGQVMFAGADISAPQAFVLQSDTAAINDSAIEIGDRPDPDAVSDSEADKLPETLEGVFQLATAGDISVTDSTLGAAAMAFDAGGSLRFDSAIVDTFSGDLSTGAAEALTFGDSTLTSAASFVATSGATLTFTDTTSRNFAHVLVDTEEMTLTNSTLEASNGALAAKIAGDLTNVASTLQGGIGAPVTVTTPGGLAADRAVTLDIGGQFTNVSGDDFGVVFGLADDVLITAAEGITNDRARILSNGDINLVTPGDILNVLPAGPLADAPLVETYTEKGRRVWWTLFLKTRRTAGAVYDYGSIDDLEAAPIINATGSLTVDAQRILNQGGELSASGGDLRLTATTIETVGLGSGRIEVETVCVISCQAEGSGSVVFAGGRLNASDTVTIAAAEQFTNRRGQVFANNDVTITAPEITLEAALVPTLIERPAGLYNFWRSKDAWVLLRDQFGTIIAETGAITLNSDTPVRRIGGELTAANGIQLSAGEDLVRAPKIENQFRQGNIGWLADWPFVKN